MASGTDQHHGEVVAFVPQLPDAVTQLPDWAEQTMAFDVAEYFAVSSTARRGATKYLDALLEFSEDMDTCFVEDRAAHTWTVRPEYATRLAVTKVRSKWFFWFLEHTNYEEMRDIFELEDLEQLREVVAEYEEGFRKLREAQREEACVFEIAISPLAITPHAHTARSVARIVFLSVHRHLADGKLDAGIDDVEMLLRLARDLGPRGDMACQLVRLILEQWCWQDLLPHILSQDGLTIEHCDRMLNLVEDSARAVNPILEAEKYEQLLWRQRLYQLERNEYDVAARVKQFHLRGSFTVPTMLLWENSAAIERRINSDVVRQSAEEMAKEDEEAKQLYEKIKTEETKNKRLTARMDRMLAAILLTKALLNVPAEDLRRDYEVLDERYGQLEKAVRQPYPERVEDLMMLRDWTRDDAWDRAEVLRVFRPMLLPPERERLATTQRRMLLCLLAVVRGQLAGEDEAADLEQPVRAAGLPQVPLDPYSGAPIRSMKLDGQYIIYSVGPDGDDDQARAAEFWGARWVTGDPPDGDISLRCTRPLSNDRSASP